MQKKKSIPGQNNNLKSSVSVFNQNTTSPFFKSVIQPKSAIHQPNDVYELEADAVADKVMRMTDNERVQTKFFKPAVSSVHRKCANCEEEEKKLQRKEMNGEEATAGITLEKYVGNLSSGGQPLPDKVRNFYEPRLGYDLSNVKVHTDTVAAKSAQSINALAYTSGSNIVFNKGQYSPDIDNGKRLLAHELTHVVQQGSLPGIQKVQKKDGEIIDPLDIVEGYTEATVHTIWLDRASGRTRFFTKGGQTYDGVASVNATLSNGSLIGKLSSSKDPRRTWDLYHTDMTIFKGGLEFSVILNDKVDFSKLSYTNSISIEVGEGLLSKLIDIKKRIKEIAGIAGETRVDTEDEKKIIRLLSDIPHEQSAEFIQELNNYMIDGMSLMDKLDSVVDMDENMALHEAITVIRMRANTEKGAKNLADAPVLAWHDVMGFFEQSATFSIEKLPNGKIRIRYLGGISSGLYDQPEYKEVSGIKRRERLDWMAGGVEFDPDQPIIVHDYDHDRYVVLTAQDLIAYQHSGNRKFIENMITIASMATPMGAAKTAAGRALVITVERILPAMVLLVEENKLNIRKWFPNWGPKIIEATEVVKVGLAIYGAAQFVKSGWNAFTRLRQMRNARKAMDAIAIAEDATELKRAENVALSLEKNADDLLAPAEKLRKEMGEADVLASSNPINKLQEAAGDTGDALKKSSAEVLVEQKKSLFTGINQETEALFKTEEGKKFKQLLENNPDVALFVKSCNSPCFPKLNEKQIGKIREIIRKADIHGIAINDVTLVKSVRNKPEKEVDEILEYVYNGLQTKIEGRAPNLPQGASTMSSAEELRRLPGMAEGGDSLKVVKGSWIHDGKIGFFPKQIADKMRGRTFKDFAHFREEFWKLVAADSDLSPLNAQGKSLLWSDSNLERMKKGWAPVVSPVPGSGRKGKMTLELDHRLAIKNEGGVYDMDNLDIVHKQFHEAVGEK